MTAVPASLMLGSLRVDTPVVLAPMAGITNAAYRRLCAEQGAGLYVSEMITSRGLVEGDDNTRKMLVFDELETVRSVQLYGSDPVYIGKAVGERSRGGVASSRRSSPRRSPPQRRTACR